MTNPREVALPPLPYDLTEADFLLAWAKEPSFNTNAPHHKWVLQADSEMRRMRNALAAITADRTHREKEREEAAMYRWLRMNRLWLKANLPMLSAPEFDAAIKSAMSRTAGEGER